MQLNVRQRCYSLLLVFVISLLGYGNWSFIALNQLKVNGPLYNDVVQSKDLIADVLPPPVYIIESYLTVLEMTRPNADMAALASTLQRLQDEYQQRQRFWQQLPISNELHQALRQADTSAAQFYQLTADVTAIPSRINDISARYREHRKAIETVVELASRGVQRSEQQAQTLVQRNTWILAVVLLTALSACILIGVALQRSIQQPLEAVRMTLQQVVQHHDLTKRVAIASSDEFGQSASAVNQLLDKFNQLLQLVYHDSCELHSASAALHQQADLLGQSAASAQRSSDHIHQTLTQTHSHMAQLAGQSDQAASLSAHSGDLSTQGASIVHQASQALLAIGEHVAHSAATIQTLDAQTQAINQVVQLIGSVADQTNLLALNAAIEAARAGESGRGFAVVADEVRALAGKTSQATVQINSLIHQVQAIAHDANAGMQQVLQLSQNSSQLAHQAADSMACIQQETAGVVGAVKQIQQQVQLQQQASHNILQSADEVQQVAADTSQAVSTTVQASNHVTQLAAELQRQLKQWRYQSPAG